MALIHASHPSVVSRLLETGIDVNARNSAGLTPLHTAAAYNQKHHSVAALIEAGADVSAVTKNGYTSLHTAAAFNPNPEIVDLLVTRRRGKSTRQLGYRVTNPCTWAVIYRISRPWLRH